MTSKYLYVEKPSPDYELKLGSGEPPKVKDGYLLVRNHAIAMNPADWKIYQLGLLTQPSNYPLTLGWDLAGIVEEIGNGVSGWNKGDRLLALAEAILKGNEEGGFREHTLVNAVVAYKLPDNLSFEQGATVPVGFLTSAVGLFLQGHRARPSASDKRATDPKETLLVLGGSSAVGGFTVQLASKHYRVISTASPHNHELVKSFGASKVFDQRDPNLLKLIQAEGPFNFVYDAIGGDVFKFAVEVLPEKATLVTAVPPDEEAKNLATAKHLNVITVFLGLWFQPEFEDFTKWALSYVSEALENGNLIPLPYHVAGNGLGSVREALRLLEDNKVSGKKIVVSLNEG